MTGGVARNLKLEGVGEGVGAACSGWTRHWWRAREVVGRGDWGRWSPRQPESTVTGHDHKIVNQLLLEAKNARKAAEKELVSVHSSNIKNEWRLIVDCFSPKTSSGLDRAQCRDQGKDPR
jgi:hypothetical protein